MLELWQAWMEAVRFTAEAQAVMLMRLAVISAGGRTASQETVRMVTEKFAAFTEAEIAAVDAAALYAARCAACHEHPFGNIPPRGVIAGHPLPRIVEALAHGAMKAQASGLTAAEIQALGRYVKQRGTER